MHNRRQLHTVAQCILYSYITITNTVNNTRYELGKIGAQDYTTEIVSIYTDTFYTVSKT